MDRIKRILARLFGQPYLRRIQWRSILHMLNVRDGQTVLDIGAGPLHYSISLARQLKLRVLALDISFRPIDVASGVANNVNIIIGNGCALPIRTSSVDRVLMSSLLQMVPQPELLLKECRRVLKPGGYGVISVPNHYQYIGSILGSPFGRVIRRLLRLPPTENELIVILNRRFGVGGPKGYYSLEEVENLCYRSGMNVTTHAYCPGPVGSILWELGVLAYVRFGNIALHGLLPFYAFARLCERILPAANGSEHIVRIEPCNEK